MTQQIATTPAGSGGQRGPMPPEPQWGPKAASSSWREGALTRIRELDALHGWLQNQHIPPVHSGMDDAICNHLETAQWAAMRNHNPWKLVTGAIYERINSNCDAAEADLLRVAPDEYVVGQIPSLVAHCQRHLPITDTRRVGLEQLASRLVQANARDNGVSGRANRVAVGAGLRRGHVTPGSRPGDSVLLDEADRTQLIGAVRAASSQAGREQAAVRSFRNVLAVTTLVLALLAVAVAIFGFRSPTTVPLCFNPEKDSKQLVVCPTGQSPLESVSAPGDIDDVVHETVNPADLFTVEFIGLIAAAIAAAAALRRLRGSTLPYGLPSALAVLKLPTGALTAFVGLLLMRGQFVPGLSALDSSAQILAWAALFGYAQQLFTRLVDQQAHAVLDSVRGAKHQEGTATAAAAQT
jgi:hypothetical protein